MAPLSVVNAFVEAGLAARPVLLVSAGAILVWLWLRTALRPLVLPVTMSTVKRGLPSLLHYARSLYDSTGRKE